MEMTAVWKERKSKSPFPLFPHCLGKLAKNASFPHSHSLGDDLGFPFFSSSFNFNFNEKCYLHPRYLLLPTCPFAQQSRILRTPAKPLALPALKRMIKVTTFPERSSAPSPA